MSLPKSYPREWKDIENKKIPKKEINEYLLKFVARLLKEVKEGKREDIDLGDGFSIGIMHAAAYKLNPEVYGFLFRLDDYGMQDFMGHGDSEYGEMLETPEEVERELKRVAKKLGIKLDL